MKTKKRERLIKAARTIIHPAIKPVSKYPDHDLGLILGQYVEARKAGNDDLADLIMDQIFFFKNMSPALPHGSRKA